MWRRWIIFIGMIVCCTAVHARVLHVGDDTMQLYETKNTTPALNVKIGDEMWYGNLTRCPTTMNATSDKYLRIQQADTDYYAYSGADYDAEFYNISDGKLTGVNCEVYLASTGTQYIDTEHIPTLVTRTEIDLRFSDDTFTGGDQRVRIFGSLGSGIPETNTSTAYEVNFGASAGQGFTLYPWICRYLSANCGVSPITITKAQKITRQTMVLDAKNKILSYGDTVRSLSGQPRQYTGILPIIIFGAMLSTHSDNTIYINTYSANKNMYVYDVKIYEDDTLVRHFVPVPCGLKIGDYTVPENGMWDIIEQKFYGNSGTGEFLYGSDE